MVSTPHLIIGLGNPGDDYARTRHNIGFMVVDEIAEAKKFSGWKKKFRSLLTTSEKFLLLKPQTFMNLSGEAALEAVQFYQIHPSKVIVFHDDLDLLPGQIKIKQGGGSGGHNGLKSLDAHLGPDYWRVRLGIGRPTTDQGIAVKGDAVSHYVLNPFSKADKIWLEPLVQKAGREVDLLLSGQHSQYLGKLQT